MPRGKKSCYSNSKDKRGSLQISYKEHGTVLRSHRDNVEIEKNKFQQNGTVKVDSMQHAL